MPKIFISDLLEILEKGFFREKLSFVEKNVYQFLRILARIYPEYIQIISRIYPLYISRAENFRMVDIGINA